MVDAPEELQTTETDNLYKFLICENIISLGALPIISSCDPAEIQATFNQIVKNYDDPLSDMVQQIKLPLCFSFPIADPCTQFSVIYQETGQVLQSFDAGRTIFYLDRCIKDTRGYVVFSHAAEGSVSSKKEYYCFVYRCSSVFESGRVVACIAEMVRRTGIFSAIPQWKTSSGLLVCPAEYNVCLRFHIDIRETDVKSPVGNVSVPKEKPNLFKFRQNLDKTIVIGVSQPEERVEIPSLRVVKCLDIALAYGRYVNDSDFVELVTNSTALSIDEAAALIPEATVFVTKTPWSPLAPEFENLNTVTERDRYVFFTVMCSLVLELIPKPIRLAYVCRAKVFQKDAAFWLPTPRRPCYEDFNLCLVEKVNEQKGWILMNRLAVVNTSPSSAIVRSAKTLHTESAQRPPKSGSASPTDRNADADGDADDATDDDEPLMSGNGGEDLRIISDEELFVAWGVLVTDWRARLQSLVSSSTSTSLPTPPSAMEMLLRGGAEALPDGALGKRVRQLIQRGIPDTLRPEIWQTLAGYQAADLGLTEAYRILLTKPCRFDMDIQRDLPRTFPAHEFFKDQTGQEALFQLTRAYALYDETVGYCQGISFIAAALLLHLPEEQAFCLLVKIMSNYGTRLLFLQNCEGLFRCLNQFERLLNDQLPDVAKAFEDLGVKAHMYASQWFLTLFMTKFPLTLVFRIFDIFLVEGLIFIFKVMISFLRLSRSILLGLDFESVLKYFRVTLPKLFRSPEACDELISMACAAKVTGNRLNRYARDWERSQEAEANKNSQLAILQREVWQLREQCCRLEKENECLADNVLSSKTEMQSTISKLEDTVESLNLELLNTRQELMEKCEECDLLERDSVKVKNMFRDALGKHEKQMGLISEYQIITANLSRRLEKASEEEEAIRPPTRLQPTKVFIDAVLACNGACQRALDKHVPGWSLEPEIGKGVVESVSVEQEDMRALRQRVRELELELAQKKVFLVDAECAQQDLSHQLMRTTADLEELRTSTEAAFKHNPRQWLAKKWTTATSRGNGSSTTVVPLATN